MPASVAATASVKTSTFMSPSMNFGSYKSCLPAGISVRKRISLALTPIDCAIAV
jgi:hypothetical protein